MDAKEEARAVLEETIAKLKTRSYQQVRDLLDRSETSHVVGVFGRPYQLETHAVWDGKAGQRLRVIVMIDSVGAIGLAPITTSLVVTPDGFVFDE